MSIPFLDQWLMHRMGWADPTSPPSVDQLRRWQLERLRTLIDFARENSPFYAGHLAESGHSPIDSLDDFSRLPMISPELLRNYPKQLLCTSQDAIERVVTVESSGTTGRPKRVFYTREDLEATKEYFAWGMANLAAPGEKVLVLMPGERPGGVGRLLLDALKSRGVEATVHGDMRDAGVAVDHLLEIEGQCIVGPAAHVNMMAREWTRRGLPADQVQSVLLCWDATPDAVVRNVRDAFGCNVFRHWGMIEIGLGGAVECAPGSGMHVRETDVFLEIIDPMTGALLVDGEFGEMVVTTLQRRGMPLIRYRTGDRGRIMAGECACGSSMRRLDPDVRRIGSGVDIGTGFLRLEDLNEVLYSLPEVGDFTARLESGVLSILVCVGSRGMKEPVLTALNEIPVLKSALENRVLALDIQLKNDRTPAVTGLKKRCLHGPGSC